MIIFFNSMDNSRLLIANIKKNEKTALEHQISLADEKFTYAVSLISSLSYVMFSVVYNC